MDCLLILAIMVTTLLACGPPQQQTLPQPFPQPRPPPQPQPPLGGGNSTGRRRRRETELTSAEHNIETQLKSIGCDEADLVEAVREISVILQTIRNATCDQVINHILKTAENFSTSMMDTSEIVAVF
ncbi:hypothetical protein DICVIV_04011 [Dictyocaulus viviparus]|uniref:Uncharacterized protein n=1 Tax=Dictyocaulus viviparus TaxID=29172 RepID=A0A0D8Y107_DICVI|nr:hypothetical protein DICVIV_04011 [Dictyocaulus viviparus]